MDINPKFTWFSPVHFDELDPMQMLHNSRFPAHVERAVSACYVANGGTWQIDIANNPDQFHVVRELHIEYLKTHLRHTSELEDTTGCTCSAEPARPIYSTDARKPP